MGEKPGRRPRSVGTAVADRSSRGRARSPRSAASPPARASRSATRSPGVVSAHPLRVGRTWCTQGQVLVELDTSVERAQLASAEARKDLAHARTPAARARSSSARRVAQAQLDTDEAQLKTVERRRRRRCRRRSSARSCARRSPASSAFAPVNLGQYLNPGTPVTVLESLGRGVRRLHAAAAAARARHGRHAGARRRSPARRRRAARRHDRRHRPDGRPDDAHRQAARQRAQQEATGCAPACSSTSSVVLPERSERRRRAGDRDRARVLRRLGLRRRGQEGRSRARRQRPRRQAGQGRAPAVRARSATARGDFVAILDGVKAGQEVVTAGAFKLRNGAPRRRQQRRSSSTPTLAPARPRIAERHEASPTSSSAGRSSRSSSTWSSSSPGCRRSARSTSASIPKLESATVTVRTVYVGASADLVRGFITTPLERAIAAADGIDYIESQSAQGLSTINVRLKLNFNAANALADISARVNQVRADLPPEAEVPAINIEPSDAQFASMYLSFGSTILEDNQVTDYLIRVVQPRLSAIEGVQRADILGGRTFAHARLAQARPHGGAQRQPRAGARRRSPPTTTSPPSARRRASSSSSTSPPPPICTIGRGVQAARHPPAGRHARAPRGRRRRRARRRQLRPGRALLRRARRCSWASGCCRTPTRSTSSSACARRWTTIQQRAADRHAGDASPSTRPSTSTDAIHEVRKTLLETIAHRHRSSSSCSSARCARCSCRSSRSRCRSSARSS